MLRRRATDLLAVAGLSVLSAQNIFHRRQPEPEPYDDAYIVFVYARRLVRDLAFHFNVEDGAVDGFTSLLDVFVKALIFLARPQSLPFWTLAISFIVTASIAACGWLAFTGKARSGLEKWGLFALLALLATSEVVARLAWITVETPLYVLLGLAFAVCVPFASPTRGGTIATTAVAMLFAISRPEAMFLIPIPFLVAAALCKRVPPAAVPTGIGVAAYLGWRLWQFGHWAPNPYYAKRSDDGWSELRDGLDYLSIHWRNPAVALPWFGAAVSFVAALCLARRLRSPTLRAFCLSSAAMALVCLPMIAVSGGDNYVELQRFVALPALLGYASLVGLFLAHDAGARAKGAVGAVALVLTIASAASTNPEWTPFRKVEALIERATARFDGAMPCDARVARALARFFPGKTIGHVDFQGLKFAGDGLRLRDLDGLTDGEVAHSRFSAPNRWGKFTYDSPIFEKLDVWFDRFYYRRSVGPPQIPASVRHRSRFLQTAKRGAVKACNRIFSFVARPELIDADVFYFDADADAAANARDP